MAAALSRGVVVLAGSVFAIGLISCATKKEVTEAPHEEATAVPAQIVIQAAPEPAPPTPTPSPAPMARKASVFAALDLPTPTMARTADGSPGPEYWQQQADYVIEAELNAKERVITGKETITYTNNSPLDLSFIWLHLEQNLFKDDSLGTLTTLQGARFRKRGEFEGGIKLQYVRAGGQDLEVAVYDTMARVDLPTPIPHRQPGSRVSSLVLEIGWSFQVPEYGEDRMGIEKHEGGEVFEIAQWFPAVAAYDDVHGWNTLPYLGQGEFYTDFGDYDVKLTVPREHIVGATGVLQNEEAVLTGAQRERLNQARQTAETVMIRSAEEVGDAASRPAGDGALTWHFKARSVRTFAWASSASFVWDAAAVNGHAGTLAQSVYPKDASECWRKSTDMLRFAIEGYNRRWFEYPYPVATNVCGPVGGMEYPMIIFCGDSGSDEGLYGVTTHEIGHNWFPMTVNTDERRHAWMDEGFNTFINIFSEAERFHDGKVEHDGGGAAWLVRPGLPPMDTPADQLGPGLLGELEYAKTGVALYLLREEVLGAERFDRAFREYIRRWAFKSPQPADFYRTMENVAGMDLGWFWRGWMVEARTLDQSVEAVEQRSDMGSATITIRNVGDMVMPVTLGVKYEDGTSEVKKLPVEVWHWTSRWKTDVAAKGRRVVEVKVDPAGAMPDVNRKNNVWKAPEPEPIEEPAPAAAGEAHSGGGPR